MHSLALSYLPPCAVMLASINSLMLGRHRPLLSRVSHWSQNEQPVSELAQAGLFRYFLSGSHDVQAYSNVGLTRARVKISFDES